MLATRFLSCIGYDSQYYSILENIAQYPIVNIILTLSNGAKESHFFKRNVIIIIIIINNVLSTILDQ